MLRAHVSNVAEAPHAQRVLGHGHRAGRLPKNRGTPWGKDLGGITARTGIDIFVHDSTGGRDGEMNSRTIEILLVEDNPGDARLTLEAFKEGNGSNNFTVIVDGVECLADLRRPDQSA